MMMTSLVIAVKLNDVRKYIDQLEQQLGGDHDLLKLIKQCLHNSPKMRPTADDIIRDVEQRVVATHTCFVQ